MLRVSYANNASEQRWSLCGRLVGPWVEELRGFWSQARRHAPRARAVVDLRDVTFIDAAGERLLAEMASAGTEFVAAGVETRHLVANLKQTGERTLQQVEQPGKPCGGVGARDGGEEK
jgi:hypothetical protein